MKKFEKEEKSSHLNPIDWFNFYGSFTAMFEELPNAHIKSETEICSVDVKLMTTDYNNPMFILKNNLVEVNGSNAWDLASGAKVSKFMLLTAVRFKGDWQSAMSYVNYSLIKSEVPFIRVGCDYFKIIKKSDRYDTMNTLLKPWDKTEINQDHGKNLMTHIFKYDDFTILPNNKTFIPVKDNCYNLYAKFSHEPVNEDVTYLDIPVTIGLMNHIFGDHVQLGLKYMKILYEHPRQIMPILCLISTERETGKTTFLNWIQMLFGENSALINPHDLTSNYNDAYATKNIIMIDETVINKGETVEKLKSIATAKSLSVSQKYVSNYSVPFFGKVIICTNKEKDFVRIDEEEIRFWIRKISVITGKKNVNIEKDLFNEIPKFLKYLIQLPEVDVLKSRMVFTQDEIATDSLTIIKEESKSGLMKDILMRIEDNFYNKPTLTEFEATPTDIKDKWFSHNSQISQSYIKKVLKEEMRLIPSDKVIKYNKFGLSEVGLADATGRPYKFMRENFVTGNVTEENTTQNVGIQQYKGSVDDLM